MALEIRQFKTFVEWKVRIPTLDSNTRSDDFYLNKLKFELVLQVTWDKNSQDEMWTMSFKKRCEAKMPAKCVLQSYVKDKGNHHSFMVRTEITQSKTDIWSYTRRSFFFAYANVEFDDNSLAFGFLFSDFQIPKFQDILLVETGDKSVQTSLHHNKLLCLESLSLDFHNLLEEGLNQSDSNQTGSNTDVQLKCGDCIVSAHRVILGARSEVFRTMLQTDMVEGREGTIDIVDMDPNVFKVFIRYLYTGILPDLTENLALPLYETGDKYRLEALRGRCGDFLAENLNPENACKILVMADAHSDKDLKERVVFYILQEKIPDNDEEWTKFCDGHPKLAIEVLRRAYKQSLCS